MHRFVRFGGLCTLILLTAGGGESGKTAPVPAEFGRLVREGSKLLSERRFNEAADLYLRGAEYARTSGDIRYKGFFENAAAGSYFSAHRYRDAESAYRAAAGSARAAREPELLAVNHLNLASLYISLWEPDAGEAELKAASRHLPFDSEHQSRLLALRMYLAARRGDAPAARRWGRAAAEAADRFGQSPLLAQIWDKLGEVALGEARLEEAEEYYTAAFRLRKFGKLSNLESSYRSLARLRLAQNRVAEAVNLSEAAARVHRSSPTQHARWWTHYQDSMVHLAAGRTSEALAEARSAVHGAAGWRESLLASQWMQSAADVTEAEAAGLLIRLLMDRGGAAASGEAFLAVEATRAKTLRSSALRNRWRQGRIPDEHGETLAQLADLEARRSTGDPEVVKQIPVLRARLAGLENQAGLSAGMLPRSAASLRELRAQLAPGEAYLSLVVRDGQSWGWVLTRDAFKWGRLPARAELSARVNEMREAHQHDLSGGLERTRELARAWFSWAGEEFWSASRWIVSADDVLFAFPWTTLDPGRPVALVPVLSFREPRPGGWAAGGLAAFGDSIYNQADPRLPVSARRPSGAGMEMPRLVGSGEEVRKVSAALRRADWQTVEHTGRDARLERLEQALERRPAVIHVAAHFLEGERPEAMAVLQSPEALQVRRPREMFLAFSLEADGRPQLLTARAVASAFQARDAVIVLSGCGSGSGDALPGAGLQGFAQSWLAAGARAVVASLWPVADDTGDFFEEFYQRLAAGQPAGDALAGARTASLQSGTWRARPSVWAGYFSMGKE